MRPPRRLAHRAGRTRDPPPLAHTGGRTRDPPPLALRGGRTRDPPPLALTGERTLPGIPDERYWYERHLVAYRLAAAKAAHRQVLDAGCGEGYGADLLAAAGASRVVGVDLDLAAVAHVARTYPAVAAVRAELSRLPFEDGRFDLVVSLQVIEHVWDVPRYLASLARVLRPDGELLLATPNRLTFSPVSAPLNPFHVREFAPDELVEELASAGLRVGSVLGVHHGARLRTVERLLRRPLPQVLAATPPARWPAGMRALVHRVGTAWFQVRADRLHDSLDLIALCRAPRPSGSRKPS
ncbi:MAG TPA: class I SAM-dependent methyltransferase [Nitriliruptorales bacterium]|nr:class I SAM-dependent methyltransferase [Nitriliruptorales bacterium]